ncbi:MAG: YceI family protein [Myxococcota bacterium]
MIWSALLIAATLADDSWIVVRVNRDEGTLFSGFSHNHAIRARQVRSEIALEQDGSCRVSLRFPVSALEVDAPASRKKYGLKGQLDQDDRADIRESMLDEDQLDGKRYPEISFVSDRCRLGDSDLTLNGKIRIRGKSKPVRTTLTRDRGPGGRMRLRGSIPIRGTDFGIEPYSAGLGAVKNEDAMSLELELFIRE